MTEDIILGQLVFAQESMEIKRYTDKDFNDNQKSQTIFYLINSNEKKKNLIGEKPLEIKIWLYFWGKVDSQGEDQN